MRYFYFPEKLYVEAHLDYLEKTGNDPQKVFDYCMKDWAFFVEVVFSYVDGIPYPRMKEEA